MPENILILADWRSRRSCLMTRCLAVAWNDDLAEKDRVLIVEVEALRQPVEEKREKEFRC